MYFGKRTNDALNVMRDEQSQKIARAALMGVGDASLGEWVQKGNPGPSGGCVWHVRRRLSEREQTHFGLSVVDMRDTDTGIARLRKLFFSYPHLLPIAQAIGEYPQP